MRPGTAAKPRRAATTAPPVPCSLAIACQGRPVIGPASVSAAASVLAGEGVPKPSCPAAMSAGAGGVARSSGTLGNGSASPVDQAASTRRSSSSSILSRSARTSMPWAGRRRAAASAARMAARSPVQSVSTSSFVPS